MPMSKNESNAVINKRVIGIKKYNQKQDYYGLHYKN